MTSEIQSVRARVAELRKAGRIADAQTAAADACATAEDAPLLRALSEMAQAQRRWPEAVAAARRAVAAAPQDAFLHAVLGSAEAGAGDSAAAEAALTEAIRLKPDSAYFMLRMSVVLDARRDYGSAVAWAEKAVRAAPDDAGIQDHFAMLAIKLRRFDDAESAIHRAAAAERPLARPVVLRRLAAIAVEREDFDRAYELARTCMDEFPDAPGVLTTLGFVTYRLGRWPEAEELAHRNLAGLQPGHPDRPRVLRCLAEIHRRQARLPEALDFAEKALAENPQDPFSHEKMSVVRRSLGHLAEAEAAAAEAARLAPDRRFADLLASIRGLRAPQAEIA